METQNIKKFDIATVREYDDEVVVTIDTKTYKDIEYEMLEDNTLFLYTVDNSFEMQLALSEDFTNPEILSNDGFVTIRQEK